jgi:hypothetical protein
VFILNELSEIININDLSALYNILKIGNFIIQGYSTTERLAESAQTFEISDSVFLEIFRGDIENINNITNGVSNELFEKAVDKLSSAWSLVSGCWLNKLITHS